MLIKCLGNLKKEVNMLASVLIDNIDWFSPPAVWLRRKDEDFVFLLLLNKLTKLPIIAGTTKCNSNQDGQSTGGHCPFANLCGGTLFFRPVWIRDHLQFQVSENMMICQKKIVDTHEFCTVWAARDSSRWPRLKRMRGK